MYHDHRNKSEPLNRNLDPTIFSYRPTKPIFLQVFLSCALSRFGGGVEGGVGGCVGGRVWGCIGGGRIGGDVASCVGIGLGVAMRVMMEVALEPVGVISSISLKLVVILNLICFTPARTPRQVQYTKISFE